MIMFNREHPRVGYSYAVTTGTYAGEILICIGKYSEGTQFLSIPKMVNREIPIPNIKHALDKKIMEVVERIPEQVFKVCTIQYKKNCKGAK